MSFYICKNPIGDTADYFGINLDWIGTFSFKTMIDGTPALLLMFKDEAEVVLLGEDAIKCLYAMKVNPPMNKN